jgi:hypothetical protein
MSQYLKLTTESYCKWMYESNIFTLYKSYWKILGNKIDHIQHELIKNVKNVPRR